MIHASNLCFLFLYCQWLMRGNCKSSQREAPLEGERRIREGVSKVGFTLQRLFVPLLVCSWLSKVASVRAWYNFQKLDIAGVCQYLWHPGHCSGPVRNGSSPELHGVLTPAWFLGELSALRQRQNILVLPKDGLSQITWALFTRGTKWHLQIKTLHLLFSERSNTGHLKNLGSQQLFPSISLWISLHYTFPGLIHLLLKGFCWEWKLGSVHVYEADWNQLPRVIRGECWLRWFFIIYYSFYPGTSLSRSWGPPCRSSLSAELFQETQFRTSGSSWEHWSVKSQNSSAPCDSITPLSLAEKGGSKCQG